MLFMALEPTSLDNLGLSIFSILSSDVDYLGKRVIAGWKMVMLATASLTSVTKRKPVVVGDLAYCLTRPGNPRLGSPRISFAYSKVEMHFPELANEAITKMDVGQRSSQVRVDGAAKWASADREGGAVPSATRKYAASTPFRPQHQ